MKIEVEVVRYEDGQKVSCGYETCTIEEYLRFGIVKGPKGVEDATALAKAYINLLDTGVSLAVAKVECQRIMGVIERLPSNPKVIEHEPTKAISHQRATPQQTIAHHFMQQARRRHD